VKGIIMRDGEFEYDLGEHLPKCSPEHRLGHVLMAVQLLIMNGLVQSVGRRGMNQFAHKVVLEIMPKPGVTPEQIIGRLKGILRGTLWLKPNDWMSV